MEQAISWCYGSQVNVRQAYIRASQRAARRRGQCLVIIDATRRSGDAAHRSSVHPLTHATSCSRENSIVILDEVYDASDCGVGDEGRGISQASVNALSSACGSAANSIVRHVKTQALSTCSSWGPPPRTANSSWSEELGWAKTTPCRVRSFPGAHGLSRALLPTPSASCALLDYQGKGHPAASTPRTSPMPRVAEEIDVARVLVNQAHTFATAAAFDNGLPFTLSMGCGPGRATRSGKSHWRCFVNITH